MANPIPEGFHTVTPAIVVRGADKAIEFYKKAFGAQELSRMLGPDKKIAHAELKIGDSIIMLSDEFPGSPCQSPAELGGTTTTLHLYVKDVDSAYKQAITAGGKGHAGPGHVLGRSLWPIAGSIRTYVGHPHP